ncbi:MAG: NAD-dependent epimerase/dehydratase family protein [bacterium]|nr:NAD-dependent epimerase/dehydratase family protein [bacterium]
MNTYLITGGEGFIGSKIVQKTKGKSFDIKSGLDVLDVDILQKETENITGIFHCAAKISVPESFQLQDEYFKTNVSGTKNIVETAEQKNCKIVFSSSAAVYGESSVKVSEDAVLNPMSPYAENKKDGEVLLRNSKIPHVALRYFNVFGPGQSKQYAGVITFFINSALKNEDLVIHGDGKQVRDFIYIDDIVQANVTAMNYGNSEFEVFNIGTGVEKTILELAEIIIELTGSKSKIIYGEPRQGDIVYSQADISKVTKKLGWKSTVSLRDGLKQTIEYYKNII